MPRLCRSVVALVLVACGDNTGTTATTSSSTGTITTASQPTDTMSFESSAADTTVDTGDSA